MKNEAQYVHLISTVVIFGTAFTMSSGLYSNAFAKCGIVAFVPTEDEQKAIHNIIFPNLQEGIVLPEDKRTMLQIANRIILMQKKHVFLA